MPGPAPNQTHKYDFSDTAETGIVISDNKDPIVLVDSKGEDVQGKKSSNKDQNVDQDVDQDIDQDAD
ncbi:hypothetical protein VKT23_019030 [Stygiomarasmius scandens]|uniref:Uncharacterized protein n=1 Tax=Marasmiellus scandens TaxID=2682957 RepID=A0ABR1IMM1_9AGAR